jgi:UDP-N-acetylglucosamine 2-epimerase (non-hydrolysing)
LFSQNPSGTVSATTLKAIRGVELGESRMVLITGSRPENFGSGMQSICGALSRLSDRYSDDVFFYPVDLRPEMRNTVMRLLGDRDNVYLMPPLDYLPFVYLMQISHIVITDSGSIQEEAPGLGKPLLVMRRSTDRPEGLQAGTLRLVGTDAVTIVTAAQRLMDDASHHKTMADAENPYGDGHASERIADALAAIKESAAQLSEAS